MKKHGVRFAVEKDGKGKYFLHFKAKDEAALHNALKRYGEKVKKLQTVKSENPSIGKELTEAKKVSKEQSVNRPVEKNMSRGSLAR